MKKFLKSLRKKWIKFWGSTYILKDGDKEICEFLIYHKTIYIEKKEGLVDE